MQTTIVLVIDHKKPIPDLAKLVELRAYTIDGVQDANVQPVDLKTLKVIDLREVQTT